jgi:hypothetical protein
MAYTTIESLNSAVQLLESTLGLYSSVLYKDQESSSSSPIIEVFFAGNVNPSARFPLERLQVIPSKTFNTLNGVPKLKLTNIVTTTSHSYNIKIIADGILDDLTDGDFKAGYIYTLYYVFNVVTEEPEFILYSQDYSAVDTRLYILEEKYDEYGQFIKRVQRSSGEELLPSVFEYIFREGSPGVPQDGIVAFSARFQSVLQSKNFRDNGQNNGIVQINGTLDLATLLNVSLPPITQSWHLINKQYFDAQSDAKIATAIEETFIASQLTPDAFETANDVQLPNGTVYFQLEVSE